MNAPFSITDMASLPASAHEQAARLAMQAMRQISPDYLSTIDEALEELAEALQPDKVCRAALDEATGEVLGWIGGQPMVAAVWELHPLAVRPDQQRRGIGTALVADLERQVAARGAMTLFVGTDDELGLTSAYGVDLYPDPLAHLTRLRDLAGHPFRFYQKCGFALCGIVPDANGFGRPDVLLAKRIGPARG